MSEKFFSTPFESFTHIPMVRTVFYFEQVARCFAHSVPTQHSDVKWQSYFTQIFDRQEGGDGNKYTLVFVAAGLNCYVTFPYMGEGDVVFHTMREGQWRVTYNGPVGEIKNGINPRLREALDVALTTAKREAEHD